jgi:hypothetical protein
MIQMLPPPPPIVARWGFESSSTESPKERLRRRAFTAPSASAEDPHFAGAQEGEDQPSASEATTQVNGGREELLSRTVRDRLFGRISREDAAERLFPLLFEGTLFQRRGVRYWLRRLGAPDTILQVAVATYRLHGGEDYLTEAASLLADQGAEAWPALRRWADRAGAEGEAFVGVVARLPNVPEEERLEALKQLARNGDESTRSRVLESAWALPEANQHALLSLLATEGPDDSVRSEARALLAEGEDRPS